MLTSGDVVDLDLGIPEGREAGITRPAAVVTAQRILDAGPAVIHVVPLTTSIRPFSCEVIVAPDDRNGLGARSAAQCQHVRAVAASRVAGVRGNVGPAVLHQVRATVAVILDLPA